MILSLVMTRLMWNTITIINAGSHFWTVKLQGIWWSYSSASSHIYQHKHQEIIDTAVLSVADSHITSSYHLNQVWNCWFSIFLKRALPPPLPSLNPCSLWLSSYILSWQEKAPSLFCLLGINTEVMRSCKPTLGCAAGLLLFSVPTFTCATFSLQVIISPLGWTKQHKFTNIPGLAGVEAWD